MPLDMLIPESGAMTPPGTGRIRIAMPWMMPSEAIVATIGRIFSASIRTALKPPTSTTTAARASNGLAARTPPPGRAASST